MCSSSRSSSEGFPVLIKGFTAASGEGGKRGVGEGVLGKTLLYRQGKAGKARVGMEEEGSYVKDKKLSKTIRERALI